MINYGGRFVYVETIEKEWPELLDTLCARCLPAFRKAVLASKRPIPSSFSRLRSCAEYETCLRQVRAWADRHSIRDEWILDAAVQTLEYLEAHKRRRWIYIPADLPVQTFEAKFEAAWIPGIMDWPTFKKNLTDQLWAKLETYRKKVGPTWGHDRRSLGTQALWTVWWQQGSNPAQIRIKNSGLGLPKVSRVNIQTGIRSFAVSIGLTLQRPAPPSVGV